MANVGVIAGNFDVIHPGYIFMFNECKKHCDTLLLLLHDDPSIERPDKIKPILSLEERIMVLSSLKQIDQIITYQAESDLYKILKEAKIQIRFLDLSIMHCITHSVFYSREVTIEFLSSNSFSNLVKQFSIIF